MGKLIIWFCILLSIQACTNLNSKLEPFEVEGFKPKIVLHADLDQNGSLKVLLHRSIPANTVLDKNNDNTYNLKPYIIDSTRITLIKNGEIVLDTIFTALRKEFRVPQLKSGDEVVIRVNAAGYEEVYSEPEIFPASIQYSAENIAVSVFNEIELELTDDSNISSDEEAFVYFYWEYSYLKESLLVSEKQNVWLEYGSCREREGYYYQCLRNSSPLSINDILSVFLGIEEESKVRDLQLVVHSVNGSFFQQYENFQFFLSDIDPAFEDPVLASSNLSNNYGSFALRNIQRIPLK